MSTEHNWPEDFSHENGNYNNDCYMCKTVFIGHKRRHVCRVCATPKSIRDQLAHLQSQLDGYRKVVAAKDEALREASFLGFVCDDDGKSLEKNDPIYRAIHKKIEIASRLTPSDLASKVLVEREELQALKEPATKSA